VFGAPVYVHWSVLVAIVLVALLSLASPVHAVVAITSYLGIITVHELGHAFAAHRLGYGVDSVWISFFHGRCEYQAPHFEWHAVIVAWAGVLAQLAIATPILVVGSIFEDYDLGYLAPAIVFLGYVNLLFALVNLAPGAGLDGQVAWRVIPLMLQQRKAKRATQRIVNSFGKRR
jgi:Zn-dependent protease